MGMQKLYQSRTIIKYLSLCLFLVVGIFLVSNLNKAFGCGGSCVTNPLATPANQITETCTDTEKCTLTNPGNRVPVYACAPDASCGASDDVINAVTGGCGGPCNTGSGQTNCPSNSTCVAVGYGYGQCIVNTELCGVLEEEDSDADDDDDGVNDEYRDSIDTTLGRCTDNSDCPAGSTCQFQDPIGGPVGFFCRSMGDTVPGTCDPDGDDCGTGYKCEFNDSIHGSAGFYCVPDGETCTGCDICSIGRVGPRGGCPATEICACVGTSCACRSQQVPCEYTLEGCGDGVDPLDPTAPSSFTFDIIPWIINMYNLSKGRGFEDFAGIIFRIALPIAVVIGMIMVGVAGLGIMTSEGDPSKAMNAKNQLTSAIIGLFFVIMGAGVLRALINTLFSGDGTIPGL